VVNHQLLAAVVAVAQVGMADQKHFMQAAQELPVKGTQAVSVYTITELQQEHTMAAEAVVELEHMVIIDTVDIIKHVVVKELLLILAEA
jgi:hypothetical protein